MPQALQPCDSAGELLDRSKTRISRHLESSEVEDDENARKDRSSGIFSLSLSSAPAPCKRESRRIRSLRSSGSPSYASAKCSSLDLATMSSLMRSWTRQKRTLPDSFLWVTWSRQRPTSWLR
ncbi:hypothetical protein MUK42_35941 [Musa troglodytarum]|uniref:Uncharacterized protein n=1 Tax=Musa troglodytarum TaxID=320322 RepID=A0A9E7I171_9LILI|nr:hypothetical protein MUK42_35941 [Musa troglodytarum]URE39233.1 hypothetical protein MUK42_35941 [Musa troglodytarum]